MLRLEFHHPNLFLQRELRTRLSLTKPDLASRVAIQQGNTVLAQDHLSKQKWQSGTVLKYNNPYSYQVQLDDGRIWRRHVVDDLQNNPSTKPEPATPSLDDATQPSSAVEVSRSLPTDTPESSVPVQDDSSQKESPPVAPVTPALQRSSRISKPPQRLIEQM